MFKKIKNSPNYHWFAISVVFIGTFMANLDSSIMNVALPTISSSLHCGLSILQWIITAYLLVISSLLPVFGRVSDLIGRKKVYSLGFLIFILGSAMCGLSTNIYILIATRVLQAVGASMLMSNSMALITAISPHNSRGKALGLTGTVAALGGLIGPALGGFLIGITSWRAIFFINVPIGAIGYLLAISILPQDEPAKSREKFDFKGAVLFVVGIVSILFAVSNGSDWGWSSPTILLSLIIGIFALIIFTVVEKRSEQPMLDLSLFKIRPFLIGNLTGGLCFMTLYANVVLMPFYLQHVLNYSPLMIGLIMTILPIIMAIAAPISGLMSDKYGPKSLTTGGLVMSALALFYFSTLSDKAQYYQIILGFALIALGISLFQSPNNSSIMGSVPAQKLGTAGSVNSLIRNLGQTIGIAYSVSLFSALGGNISPSPNQIGAFMYAYHTVMLVAMSIAIIATILSINQKSNVQK
jgi:EmrB/QacA subfamily drug resistance transporter